MAGKQLIIAEKPSVARDLAKVLGARETHKSYIEGKDVVITWALGHLLGLKMPEDYRKEWATWEMESLPMIPPKFGIKPLPKTGGQLKAISQLGKRKDITEAVVATDAGREGELVARWILEYIRFNKPVKRLWISSQTDKAIRQGFKSLKPSKAYDDLYQSALARSEADWLVGLNVTRALTVKYQDNLAAGRVQTPTLAMVRRQEMQIESFRPITYYTADLIVKDQKGKLMLKNPQMYKEREMLQKYLEVIGAKPGKVTEIKEKRKTEAAPLPYDLTEIQREANQRYQFSAKKTLSLVQSLYEIHKVVSYPRTDSKYLTKDMSGTMKERLEALRQYAPEESRQFLKNGAKVVQTKVFQDERVTDHHGLIPTELTPRPEKMNNDEQKIYQMIVTRFLGLFAPPHITVQKSITVSFGEADFVFKETQIEESGWKKDQTSQTQHYIWTEGMTVAPNFQINKELTTPPAPLSEATLLGQMEKHGLGTPATRAEIIEKLIKSELMERDGNKLKVTPKGKQLLNLVNPSLISPELTAKWEKSLEQIAQGKLKSQVFIDDIKTDTKKLVSEIRNSKQQYQDFSITKKKCPECGALLKEKNTRDGKIFVCTSETCSYKRRKEPKVSNHRCPQCHRKMEIHEGTKGAYFKCKYCSITEKVPDKKERNKKLTKHEERQLMKKYSQESQADESPLALALKAALGEQQSE